MRPDATAPPAPTGGTDTMPALFSAGDGAGPDFVCIGAQKAGTRWLYDQLSFRPDFWMPPIKEVSYLDQRSRRQRAETMLGKARSDLARYNQQRAKKNRRPLTDADLEWLEAFIWLQDQPFDLGLYAGLFNGSGDRLTGDVTPDYCIMPDRRLEDAGQQLPRSRFVYLVRDPVERFWSQCQMYARNDKWEDRLQDVDAIRDFSRRSNSAKQSRATEQVERWSTALGERFGFFFFDDIRDRPDAVLGRIVSFVGGDPAAPGGTIVPDFNRKANTNSTAMSEPVRQFVVELFADEVLAAARRLGGPAEAWPARYGL